MEAEYQKGGVRLLDAASVFLKKKVWKKNLGVFTYNINLFSVNRCVFLKSTRTYFLLVSDWISHVYGPPKCLFALPTSGKAPDGSPPRGGGVA